MNVLLKDVVSPAWVTGKYIMPQSVEVVVNFNHFSWKEGLSLED